MANQTEANKIRYEMRDEIENIIKEYHIDRIKFHEVAKNEYEKVLRKLYYSFCDYQKYPVIQIPYLWTRFRDNLNSTELIAEGKDGWRSYIDKLDDMIPDGNFMELYYLVTDGEWVYEGTLGEIKKVLYEYPASMEDFYLFPKDYRWLVSHCDDGGCMCRIWKQGAD